MSRLVRIIESLYGTLKSLRFTAAIILSISSLYLVGLVVTQKSLFQSAAQYREWQNESFLYSALHALRVTEIYTSPLMMFLLALFFLNLVIVTVGRVPGILRKCYLSGEIPKIDTIRIKGAVSSVAISSTLPAELLQEKLGVLLSSRRWKTIHGATSGTFLALRNRFSPFGFILFHGSFLLCLIGALLIAYTRFSGNVEVAEGELVKGRLDQLGKVSKQPYMFRALPEISLKVNRIETRYEDGVPSDLDIDLESVIAGITQRAKVKINEPFSLGAITLVAQNIGLAPMVVVTTPDGEVVDNVFVRLNVLKGRSDSFMLGTNNQYLIRVTYFPDYAVYNGVEATRGPDPKNPAFHLVITDKGTQIYDGTVKLGEAAEMGGFMVSFRELRYWTNFQVVREYGQWLLISGFASGLMGLVMRLIFYQKRILIVTEDGESGSTAYLQGQAEYFGYSFACEVADIACSLQKELNGGGINA